MLPNQVTGALDPADGACPVSRPCPGLLLPALQARFGGVGEPAQ
jgi:hypothetical protein